MSMACHERAFGSPDGKAKASRMAERVGFAPLPVVENKELKVFWLPPDQPDPLKSPGRDTY